MILLTSRISVPSFLTRSRRHPLLLSSLCWLFAATPATRAFFSDSMSSSSFTTERTGDGLITIAPKNEGDQSALVVISHGLGDSAEGFADVAEMLAREMPYVKVILPTAPTQPVTMNMGMRMPSWYDIVGLDERANEHCNGIAESRATLEAILAKEHADTGLPYSRMVLAGFSQGGALSLFTGLQLPEAHQKLAGVVVLSGYLPAASQFTLTPGLEDVPLWHGHGTQDALVRPELADKSREAVTAQGLKSYEIHKYPCAHTVDMNELRDMMGFLKQVLPADDACKITLKEPSDMSIKELKAAIRKAGLQSKAIGFTEKREFIELVTNHRNGKL